MKNRSSRLPRILLIFGFLAVVISVLVAHASPARGYEVSIYQSTPVGFWVGVAIALSVSLVVVVSTPTSRYAVGGVALAGVAITAVSALPLIRRYHFYGFNDSLTHLGWAKGLSAGTIPTVETIYPSGHISAGMFSSVLGLEITQTMMLVVLFLSLTYLVFVPLIVHMIVPDRRAVLIGVFSALLFLPVNLNGFKLMFFPYSLATFLGMILLYLFFKHQFSVDEAEVGWQRHVTPTSVLFVIGSVALVTYHIQAAANFLVLFAVASVLQFVYSRKTETYVLTQRPVYGLTVAFALVFSLWMAQYTVGFSTGGLFIDSILGVFSGDSGTGTAISQRTESVSAVGGGLLEVFVKLFLLKAVYALVTLGVFVGLLFGRFSDVDERGRFILRTLTFGLAVLVPYFFANLFGSISETNFFFRHVGFAMALSTIVGSVGLYYVFGALSTSTYGTRLKSGAPVPGLVVFAVALLVVFPSPYIYLPSNHVPEQQFQAHDSAFTVADEDIRFVGIRDNPGRFVDALPERQPPALGFRTPEEALSDLPAYYDGPRYLMVSQTDYDREVIAYRELRYSEKSLSAVENQPKVNRVISNGAADLYYISE
ncbi:hypothetical protein GJR96_17385 [Haloferax sp. MBLA0076]|uniref:DUF2206 domain-containing protein n=1 Tax=Haloferax litoreum TaxID=2666140 RepID=A0A6A8GLB5_9EURY|nr:MULTISPECIES: hypothetical protein [Haloferax]KAB1189948.1 hypothetical protein Hfx1148_17320 [Haloferax sp. CBA1148]MRX23719.1 hypothetical protein [Haloferax litoreum]